MARLRIEADLLAAFRAARVLTLDELVVRLSVSRRTIVRRLTELGYIGSYNASGRFLTLEEVARFDARGLWGFRSARFSRFGTLKETLVHFVASSAAGMTHEEISGLLGVRAQNTLRDLVRQGAISREPLGGAFVYLGVETAVRQAQVDARSLVVGEPTVRPTTGQVIAVLLELVRDPGAGRDDIVSRAGGAGVRLSRTVVDAIFARYDLDESNDPE